MQLHTARLCLDCEELHEEEQCPVCASLAFGYIARWVPALRQPRPRLVAVEHATGFEAYRRLLDTGSVSTGVGGALRAALSPSVGTAVGS